MSLLLKILKQKTKEEFDLLIKNNNKDMVKDSKKVRTLINKSFKLLEKQDDATIVLFIASLNRLVVGKPLLPITNNLNEWTLIEDNIYISKRYNELYSTKELLEENKAIDNRFYYKKRDGKIFFDKDCSKVVDLPYIPKTDPEEYRTIKDNFLILLESIINKIFSKRR